MIKSRHTQPLRYEVVGVLDTRDELNQLYELLAKHDVIPPWIKDVLSSDEIGESLTNTNT